MKASSPKSDGMTACGIWLMFCVVMVFGVLAEYGVILFLKLKKTLQVKNHSISPTQTIYMVDVDQARQESREKKEVSEISRKSTNGTQSSENTANQKRDNSRRQLVVEFGVHKVLDLVSLILFPTTFSFFIIMYFLHFTTADDTKL